MLLVESPLGDSELLKQTLLDSLTVRGMETSFESMLRLILVYKVLQKWPKETTERFFMDEQSLYDLTRDTQEPLKQVGEAILFIVSRQISHRHFFAERWSSQDSVSASPRYESGARWFEIQKRVSQSELLDRIWRESPSAEAEAIKTYSEDSGKLNLESVSLAEITLSSLKLPILSKRATSNRARLEPDETEALESL